MGKRPAWGLSCLYLLIATAMFERRKMARFLTVFVLSVVGQDPRISLAQNTLDSEKALRAVANTVVNDSAFCFVDQKTSDHFKSAAVAPKDAQLRLAGPYADWRYWNGVLNIALIRLGEVLRETSWSDFPVTNIAFSFDNFRYFEERYKGEGKMFTYAIARSVNRGYIEPRYASIAQRGWEGVMARIRPNGQVEGVSAGTVVSDDLVYYYRRPTQLNDVHGIGVILLAGAEMLQLRK